MPCERERQPLFTTVPVLAKMSKQILHDTIGLVLNPWNWKVRLYGTQTKDKYSNYEPDATHKVYQFDAAPNKITLDSQPSPSPRVPRSTSTPVHESKRGKKTVHFLEPEYSEKLPSAPSHPKFPAERAKLELYEVVCPANDIPRVIDIDYDTKANRWCIDESRTFPDREDPVAMICSRSVLRAIQHADSSTRRSTPASSTLMPQFQINRLPNHGVIKNPGGDLATLKASSHDLFHIGNLEKFLLHTHEHPQHVLLVDGGQYMKHWLIDLRQLVAVLSTSDTRQKCKSAFWDLVHHGIAEKVTLQLWGAGDLPPQASTDIETLDWATWIRLYRNQISETLRQDLDWALGFLHPGTVPGSSWPAAVHPSLSIMSHKGLMSGCVESAEIRDGQNAINVDPWYASSHAHDIAPRETKQSRTIPNKASTMLERLSSNNNDDPARARTPYASNSRIPQSTRLLPQAPGPRPCPRLVIPPLRPWSPAFELQDSAGDSDFTDIDVHNEEDVSGTHRRALAEVDYGKETGGLVDPNKTASGAPVEEKRPTRNLTRLLKGPRVDTSAYERLKGHFKDQGLVQSRKCALEPETAASRHDKTKDDANPYPAFSNQLDDALAAKQRLIQSLTATQQDLEKARQGWAKDQEILRNAGLLKRDLRVDLEEKWAASRLLEVQKCLAELDELRNQASERTKMSTGNSDAVKGETGQYGERMEVASPQSMLDAVVDKSRKLEGTMKELEQAKRSLQPNLGQDECPKILTHDVDRPRIISEDAAEPADSSGLRSLTIQDSEATSSVRLKHPTRRSWTPDDDDKASFRLSAPQQTNDGVERTRAVRHSTSPSTNVQSHRGEVLPEVDPNSAPTTPDGSNISIFGSVSPSTDSKKVAGEANGNVDTESDEARICSGSGFEPVRKQASHLVNDLNAESIKSVSKNEPLLADGHPFEVVTNSRVADDGAAACPENLLQDIFVAGSDEPFVGNAIESPQTAENDDTASEHKNRNKVADITRLADLDNDALSDSEEPPKGFNVEALEELNRKALLVSPTNLTAHVRSSPSSSGKKKGAARKKWTRVQWID